MLTAATNHGACSGCSLCLLVCPVWRSTHDIRLTPHGRAKALQHGATIVDIAASVESCTMCGACEPVCPEKIDLVDMIVELRRQLPDRPMSREWAGGARVTATRVLLAGSSLRAHPTTVARVAALLDVVDVADDGADIALALETGAAISSRRLEGFLAPLRRARLIVVGDGLLLRHLRGWLPRTKVVSVGAALIELPAIRRQLRATDLYVIEPRAYHADYERQVRRYDALRVAKGCAMNLDLQRIAVPASTRNLSQAEGREQPNDDAHVRWILEGRAVERIVVESYDDARAFARASDCPVTHVAHLAE